jgi:hypothetical protein
MSDPQPKDPRPDTPQPPDPRFAAWYPTIGRGCEIVAVSALAGVVFLYPLGFRGNWLAVSAAILLIIAVLAYKAAIYLAITVKSLNWKKRREARKVLASAVCYKVTGARLETLKQAGVPPDVTNVLRTLKHSEPLPEKRFLEVIARDRDLGWARTEEFKHLILQYTKLDGDRNQQK